MKHKTYLKCNGTWLKLFGKNTTDSFIAGDDDQAIFRWAGADVDSFIAQEGQMLPLQQSYRIPAKVHGLAMGIINKIKTRIDKTWQPKTHQGCTCQDTMTLKK